MTTLPSEPQPLSWGSCWINGTGIWPLEFLFSVIDVQFKGDKGGYFQTKALFPPA